MAWTIEIDAAAERDLKKLGREPAKRIVKFLNERLAPMEDPRALGQALKGAQLGQFWKYRVGDYRVIADIEDAAVRVLIVRIGHRREVYLR